MSLPTLQDLLSFSKHVTIDSKEEGLIRLHPLYGSQLYFLREVLKGLEEGVHHFDILKAKQLGISTICLLLDLYWIFKYGGTQGAIATDTETNRDYFRSILTAYMDSLPRQLKYPIKMNNRNVLELKNRSRINYLIAGTRFGSHLGQGKALNFLHATETAAWKDEDGLDMIMGCLAQRNPIRLYLFESQALGFNIRWDMWQKAKNSISQRAIFIGWWLHELYRVSRETIIFQAYGEEPPTPKEREWIGAIKALYNYEITPEQLAWFRWIIEEHCRGDEQAAFQKYPPTEDYAFILSGSRFFSTEKLTQIKKQIIRKARQPDYYRYNFGSEFQETTLRPCPRFQAQLKIWGEPSPIGVYAVSADPSFGSSPESDNGCIQVLRCYADGADQMAELCCNDMTTYQFTWAFAHLAGAYKNSHVILEVNGPGMACWQELKRLQDSGGFSFSQAKGLEDVFGNIRHYLWQRPDTISGSFAYHFKTTSDTKEWIYEQMRDMVERDKVDFNSDELIEELRYVTRQGSYIGVGSSKQKDDRAIAMALAIEVWLKSAIQELYDVRMTRTEAWRLEESQNPDVLKFTVQNFMSQFRPDIEPIQ